MGWGSASSIMNVVIENVKKHVPDEKARHEIYLPIYNSLTNEDWDTVNESIGLDPVFDKIAAEDGWTENGYESDGYGDEN